MNGNILITGGLGNLGCWISCYLSKNGFNVYILTRKEHFKIPNLNYHIIECDLTDQNKLKHSLSKFNFDYCIHLASYNEYFEKNYYQKALNINTLGTRNLLSVLSQLTLKHFIYFSTFHVYGKSSGIITEDTNIEPTNDYAITHLFAEFYVKQFSITHALPYTILRLTNSYGSPFHKSSSKWYLVLNNLVKSAYEKNKILLKSNGKEKRDFIYMGDIANITNQLLQKKATNTIYNLSSENTYEIIHLAKCVRDVYKLRYNKQINILCNNNDTTIYNNLLVKNTKIKQFISFNPKNMLLNEIDKIFNLLEYS